MKPATATLNLWDPTQGSEEVRKLWAWHSRSGDEAGRDLHILLPLLHRCLLRDIEELRQQIVSAEGLTEGERNVLRQRKTKKEGKIELLDDLMRIFAIPNGNTPAG